jgi:cyclomaltodextrin glucanotransferase
MARLDADDNGFIDANNWLFTARGIPAVYYGSETGFERGRAEHMGNRNYFGQERVDAAPRSPIHQALTRIAHIRAESPALQRGLQLDLELQGERAAFYRVLQHDGENQIALVLLNKGDAPSRFEIRDLIEPGHWREAVAGSTADVAANGGLASEVPAHGVRVWLLDGSVTRDDLRAKLAEAMAATRGKG